MKLFVSAMALLAFAGCATHSSHYGTRGVASSDLKRSIDGYAEEFPECTLGEWGDLRISVSYERKCVLGAIAHELKLTGDQGILTATVENYVDAFVNLENHYAGSKGGTSPEIPYSNYQILRAAVKAYREAELAAKSLDIQTAAAMTQKIEAENAAEVSKSIEDSVAENNRTQQLIKVEQLILSKEAEYSYQTSVKRFLELRKDLRRSQLADINTQGRELKQLSKRVEATFSELSRRYDGTDEVLNAILSNLATTARTVAALDYRIQQGLAVYAETCAASDRSVKKAFSGEELGCSRAIVALKAEVQTLDNLIAVTSDEIKAVEDVIKAKSAAIDGAGTPKLAITKAAASKAKENALGFYVAQLGVLESSKVDLGETRSEIAELILLVEGQVAEFKSDEKAFMAKQEAEMARRQSALDVINHSYRIRGEAVQTLFDDIEKDKASAPEAGLLRLTYAREMLKLRKSFLKSEARTVKDAIDGIQDDLEGFYKETLGKLAGDIEGLQARRKSLRK